MIRNDELASQLIEKVREYFPKPVRDRLGGKVEGGATGTAGTIVIQGRFENQVPQFEPRLLPIFEAAPTEKKQETVTIKGKYQGVDCQIQLRWESLAAAARSLIRSSRGGSDAHRGCLFSASESEFPRRARLNRKYHPR